MTERFGGRRARRRWLAILATLALLPAGAGPVAASATGTEHINLVLPTGLQVSGSVTDPLGGAIEGASAGLCPDEFDCFAYDGETDAAGHWSARGVVPGTYLVRASAQGYLDVWLGAGGTSVTDASQAITIDVSGDTTIPNLQLAAGFSISGTLTDPDGHGVPDVQIYPTGGSTGGVVTTDASGNYSVTGLAPGFFGLQVAPPVGSPFTGGSISSAGTISEELFDYWINVAGDVTGVDATLVVGRSISGTVTGLAGPADVNVSGTVFGRSLEIAPDGTFDATGLWPDVPQTLFVAPRDANGIDQQFPYGVYDGTSNLNPDQSTSVAIDVSAGDVAGLNLSAPTLPSVTGTVLDAAPSAVGGWVTLCSDQLGCAQSSLAGDGSYGFINLPDATYHLYLAATDHQSGYVTASGGISRNLADAVDIVVAGVDQVVDVTVPVGLTLSGTITGPTGEPVVGGNVSASFADGQFVASATTDSAGDYVIRGLEEGDYFIYVNGPEHGNYFSGYWSLSGYTSVYEQADLVHVPSDLTVAIATNPANGATNVSRTIVLTATYSAGIANVTSATVQLHAADSTTSIKGALAYDPATFTITFTPKVRLHGRTTYVFVVDGVTTTGGGAVPPVNVTFTTRR